MHDSFCKKQKQSNSNGLHFPQRYLKKTNKQGFSFLKMRLSCAVGNTKSSCGQQSISRKDPVDSYTSQCHWTGASIGSTVEPGTFTQVQFYCSCNVFEHLYVLLILFLKQVFETWKKTWPLNYILMQTLCFLFQNISLKGLLTSDLYILKYRSTIVIMNYRSNHQAVCKFIKSSPAA